VWGPGEIDERFKSGALDPAVWTAAYLPAWTSLSAAAASYTVESDGLHLRIPPDQPLWCPDVHEPPLRVSAVQSGNWSGPVGSTRGQQRFRDGLVVREQQETRWGFTPLFGSVEVTCRASIDHRSMFSAWLVGLEDEPERCGEICIVEVFGDAVGIDGTGRTTAAVGSGLHRFRDPSLSEEFSADPYPIDVDRWHRYAVDWRPGSVTFMIDDRPTKTLDQAPNYPMQLIIGIFDFPDLGGAIELAVPELVVSSVQGRALSAEREVGTT
jgi:glycosyl hydrolase family 16